MAKKSKKTISPRLNLVFVCTGNTCRSPMAEYIFKDFLRKKKMFTKYAVSSSGVYATDGDKMTKEAAAACTEMGVKTDGKHKARLLTIDIIQNADIIVCMTDAHRQSLTASKTYLYASGDGAARIIGTAAELIGSDIDDPYGGGEAEYRAAAESILSMCEPLLTAIISFRESRPKFKEK